MTTVTPVETLESSETDQTLQRPPPGSRAHRALVVSADPAVRDGWARALEATGLEVHRCAGPGVNCILLGGGERCPLLDETDIAVYHEPALTRAFLERLGEVKVPALIVATRDRQRTDGDHEPAFSRVVATPGR